MLTQQFAASDHGCFERVILTWISMLIYSPAPQIIVSAKLSKNRTGSQSQKGEAGAEACAEAGAPMMLKHGPRACSLPHPPWGTSLKEETALSTTQQALHVAYCGDRSDITITKSVWDRGVHGFVPLSHMASCSTNC